MMGKKLSKITALFLLIFSVQTLAQPVVSIIASGATRISVAPTSLAAIYYTVTNNTNRNLVLNLEPLQGITQSTTGAPYVCGHPIALGPHGHCLLTLIANGSQLPKHPVTGLRLSRKTNQSKIYSTPPSGQDIYVTQASDIPGLVIVSGDPIRLQGYIANETTPITKVLTLQNASTTLTTKSIEVALTSVEGSLPSDVTVDATNCNPPEGLLPGQTCLVYFTPATPSGSPNATEFFDVIITADDNAKYQTTARLTLNPPVPITFSSEAFGTGPQIIPFPEGSGSLQLTLTNISSEPQTLQFAAPDRWNKVSITGCSSPLSPAGSPSSSCVLEFTAAQPNYAGIFTITAISNESSLTVPVPMAFADSDNNLVYSVQNSSYRAVYPNPGYLQWCPPGDNPCNQITTHADDLYNGLSNTNAITTAFGESDPNYAASLCVNLVSSNYYLPAICELGDSLQSAGCKPNTDNIYSNLVQYGFLEQFNGPFWSSTEIQAGAAWLEFFYGPFFSYQYQYVSDFYASVACVTNKTYP
jgi:hypothetical protein